MIYLDNAATTRPAAEAAEAMRPWLEAEFGNPSAIYTPAARARAAVAAARRQTARLVGAAPEEIFFTSGGTESDNWALLAVLEAGGPKKHIITSRIEHPAVLRTCRWLEERDLARVTYLPVDSLGMVDPAEAERAMEADTVLLSVMTANNEIGTIQPVRELAAAAHRHGVLFHTDAVQACGHIPLSVRDMGIDLLSASGHKFHGPKGAGFLYIRKGLRIPAFLHGGAQEGGLRAGTENVAGIVGLGAAAQLAEEKMRENAEKVSRLRDLLLALLRERVPDMRLNGHPVKRLPGSLHLGFACVDGESLLIRLDMRGICASAGSACAAGATEPSHVLRAVGCPEKLARGALRLTLAADNTEEEIRTAAREIAETVEELRAMSAEWIAHQSGGNTADAPAEEERNA